MNMPYMRFGWQHAEEQRRQDLRDSYEPNAFEDFDFDSITEEELAEVHELDADVRDEVERALHAHFIYEDTCTAEEWSQYMFAALTEMNK